MQYRPLGNTGIRVSEIGFGAWAIGGTADASGTPLGWGRTSDEESLITIRRARDLGVTFFDTADSYGFGRSESLLGIVLSRFRNDIVLATKVGVVRTSDGALRKDFSKQHIFNAVDGISETASHRLHRPPSRDPQSDGRRSASRGDPGSHGTPSGDRKGPLLGRFGLEHRRRDRDRESRMGPRAAGPLQLLTRRRPLISFPPQSEKGTASSRAFRSPRPPQREVPHRLRVCRR